MFSLNKDIVYDYQTADVVGKNAPDGHIEEQF